MKCDYLIKGGCIVDPSSARFSSGDILISNGRIVSSDGSVNATEVIDASGCYVLPGLIDFHTHMGYRSSDFGLDPDLYYLPNGVTAAVDAGSGGTANFEAMLHSTFRPAAINIKAFLNVAATGIITEQYLENLTPSLYDTAKMEYLLNKYPDDILGFKTRVGVNTSGNLGFSPLKTAVELGTRFGKRVYLHAVDIEADYGQLLSQMRSGDILGHCFQGKGKYTLLDKNGKPLSCVIEARERGVLFDCACGRVNHSLEVMRKCFDNGFYPDIISTDVIGFSVYGSKLHSLLSVMSEYLAMGMAFNEIVRAVTAVPAHLMGMDGKIGTLSVGAEADVFITCLKPVSAEYHDCHGNSVAIDKVFFPLMTFRAGRPTFRQIDFM